LPTPTLESATQNMSRTPGTTALTDRDICMELLADAKSNVKTLADACLEASTPEVRQYFGTELRHCLDEQDQIWRFAQQKGWYKAYDPPRQQADASLQEALKVRR
jgi:spore coat protein CotF